jgi:hypothetical protein
MAVAKENIIEQAVRAATPFMTAEEANEEIIRLLQQVGRLERSEATLKERNAHMENGLKAASAQCAWRQLGYCNLHCGGRVFCKADDLEAVDGLAGLAVFFEARQAAWH